ncbi:hypothetical protein [Peptostreptococcus faecalis]|uniref:hypothetical protein n=1 Tax=Peptostreptococcus faecalis TaxID=2045015 RepID=UPI000C7E6EA4|nr:hypothetical protein [Peptostreptococcus faecalis]
MKIQDYAKSVVGINNIHDFRRYKKNINNIAKNILEEIKVIHPTDTGMYYETTELKDLNEHSAEERSFIINDLKKMGVEFIENNTLYRY